jgi:hypothetical protein
MHLSAWSVPAVFCCMSVHLSTASSAVVPFSTLTEVLWMVVEMSCVQNQSQSVFVRNCGDQKKGRLKACRRGWKWIVVSLYVRGSGCWCRYRYVVDSCLGNKEKKGKDWNFSGFSAQSDWQWRKLPLMLPIHNYVCSQASSFTQCLHVSASFSYRAI